MHSKFFIQEDRTALIEIAEKPTLPAFASNFTTDGISANRVLMPISDPEAKITFFVSAKTTILSRFPELFQLSDNDKILLVKCPYKLNGKLQSRKIVSNYTFS